MTQSSLRPLADRMRPHVLDDYIGQTHILGAGKPLRRSIETGVPHSMVFWGPPGTGKTTLARIASQAWASNFLTLSAVTSGVKDIREAVAAAQQNQHIDQRPTVVFVDEVHRFNKSQQDAFLPYIEDGTIIFIGATTENPSFELNNALLSRARVYILKSLDAAAMGEVIHRALGDVERGLGGLGLSVTDDAKDLLVQAADGDARRALTYLELASQLAENTEINAALVQEVIVQGVRRFDKGGEFFYDTISALHKSVRGSDPDAALYWYCRMLDGGCDALYIARRVVRMASEDIGNADPRALQLALNAWDVQERLGSPEGELAIAQAIVFLSCAAKSNAVYKAYNAANAFVKSSGTHEVPMHLRNAPTKLMKEAGYGQAYRYAHDEPDGFAAGVNYFPDDVSAPQFYVPVDRGMEKKIGEKLAWLRARNRDAHRQ